MNNILDTAIKQNDPACYPMIQKVGCFFRSAAAIAENASGKLFLSRQINDLWDWAQEKGYISKENNIRESAPIINKALENLGSSGKFYEVGTFLDGKVSWYSSVPSNMRHIDACIQKIKQNGPEGTHFRLVSSSGRLTWDPHYPEIKVKGIFYTILYCFVG